MSVEVVDGGDRGCLLATDSAAPIHLLDWCHLTGNTRLGQGLDTAGRPLP